jgi:hypothetical protein
VLDFDLALHVRQHSVIEQIAMRAGEWLCWPCKVFEEEQRKEGVPLAGRCRGVSWREAPRLCNVPFAQSGRAPSGAQLTALLGCMRFATVLLNFPHKVYQQFCVNTPCQPTLLTARLLPRSPLTCGALIISPASHYGASGHCCSSHPPSCLPSHKHLCHHHQPTLQA